MSEPLSPEDVRRCFDLASGLAEQAVRDLLVAKTATEQVKVLDRLATVRAGHQALDTFARYVVPVPVGAAMPGPYPPIVVWDEDLDVAIAAALSEEDA